MPHELSKAIVDGDRRALARGITLVESTRADHRESAIELLETVSAHAGTALRLAISGTPGVGKSTFIESFGLHLIEQGQRVAVLAIDPSSTLSGGSILGDKTRMERLTREPNAFIRPSPSSGTLGGVAARTREVMLLCEAAGYDEVIIETVGVGQSETMASQMTDMFILLLAPGGGDELQGIKRGIMELADMILVNKADGPLAKVATKAVSEHRLALQLIRPRSEHWRVPVEAVSALTDSGIDTAWQKVCEFRETMQTHGELKDRRVAQARQWMWAEINDNLALRFREDPRIRESFAAIDQSVVDGRLSPTAAAHQLLDLFQLKTEN